MVNVTAQQRSGIETTKSISVAVIAWLVTAVFYFYQYSLRSSPAVMMPQLSEAFSLSAVGVASMVGLFYYGYSPFSLVAGAAMDRVGPSALLPFAAAAVGVWGAYVCDRQPGSSECRQVASRCRRRLRTDWSNLYRHAELSSLESRHVDRRHSDVWHGWRISRAVCGWANDRDAASGGGMFWIGMGVIGLLIGGLLLFLFPRGTSSGAFRQQVKSVTDGFQGRVQKSAIDPVRINCRACFIPTTVFDMIWGVRYLQEARGFDYAFAVMLSASVPFGWIIGCPLLGFISDRIGRRKPVIIGGAVVLLACLAWILFGRARRISAFYDWSADRDCLRSSDVAIHGNQGSQPAAVWRHSDGRG